MFIYVNENNSLVSFYSGKTTPDKYLASYNLVTKFLGLAYSSTEQEQESVKNMLKRLNWSLE